MGDVVRWHLFVDESGSFDNLRDRALVAGVLAQVSELPSFERRARGLLEQATPLSPWPLHAWTLHQSTLCALWAVERPRVAQAQGVLEHARWLLHQLEGVAPHALAEARTSLALGREPARATLAALERAAQALPARAAYSALRGHVLTAADQRRVAVLALQEDPRVQALWGFIASEDRPGHAMRQPEGAALQRQDRYIQLLVVLIERVAAALSRQEGQHVVSLQLANRHVWHELLGDRASLSHPLVREALKLCEGEAAERVRWSVAPLVTYDREAPAGIVLADLLANAAYRALRHHRPLDMVEAQVAEQIGLPLISAAPSHVAAAHDSRDALAQTPRPEAPPALDASARWARDQVARWWS